MLSDLLTDVITGPFIPTSVCGPDVEEEIRPTD